MGYITTVYATSVAWNSVTWNGDPNGGAGGLIRVMFSLSSTDIQDRTGNQFYPMLVQMVNGSCTISVVLREVKNIFVPGTKSNMTITLGGKAGAPVIAALGMCFRDETGTQNRGETGECALNFVHESGDGQTPPLS